MFMKKSKEYKYTSQKNGISASSMNFYLHGKL
jgi:hypothetical protein